MWAKLDFSKTLFVVSVGVVIFGYGVVVGTYRVFPYHQLELVKDTIAELYAQSSMMAKIEPTEHLKDGRHDGTGALQHRPNSMSAGYTLVTGFFDGGLEIRLLSPDGSPRHRWPVQFSGIWEGDLEHVQPASMRPATDWNTGFNGAMALPDASVIFNMIGGGLVKLDRCGDVVWKLHKMAHHSVEANSDGGFWVPGQYYVASESRHPPIEPPYRLDTIMKVSSGGIVEREIAVLDVFWQQDLQGILFANNRTMAARGERDFVHLNDIEELPAELGGVFPQFEAGDLLLSLREPNMIAVLDSDLQSIKWHQIGPWLQQHDVDWQPDGTITLFDNRYDGNDGAIFGGSRILSVNPQTREVTVLYEDDTEPNMYSATQGDHQILGNGNILITESEAGRALEVNQNGEIVWEYINRYSPEAVVRLPDAIRYDKQYFEASLGERGCERST